MDARVKPGHDENGKRRRFRRAVEGDWRWPAVMRTAPRSCEVSGMVPETAWGV